MTASLAPIVRALGGELHAGGRDANVPGPGHGSADRSVSLRLLPDGMVLIHCFAGDDWRAVRAMLKARGLLDAGGRLTCGAGGAPAAPGPGARVRTALELWREAGPVSGTLSAKHLRRRAIDRDLGERLRHHPAAPSMVYERAGARRPALLALLTGPADIPCGVEVTYLGADAAKAAMRTPRKIVGLAPAGCAVRLDPAGETLLVAEGVASALSASERLGLPAWALLSAGRLHAWIAPPGVRRVVIAADRGEVGMTAARRLAARMRRSGVAAELAPPPIGFGDWNDVAVAEAREGKGRAGRGEPEGTGGPDPAARSPSP